MKHLKLYENFEFNDEDFDFEEENPNKSDVLIPDKDFVKFLNDHNCYNEFIENFNGHINTSDRFKFHKYDNLYDYIQHYIDNDNKEEYIQNAFDWEKSGDYDFWEDLEGQWMTFLNY